MNNERKIADPKPKYRNPQSNITSIDRVPPHSFEAEVGVLGAILLDGGTVMGMCIEKQIEPESFYDPMNRIIFEIMLDQYNATRPLDILTVGECLKVTGILDRIGGPTALNRIVDATPTSAHAEYYMDIVRDQGEAGSDLETRK